MMELQRAGTPAGPVFLQPTPDPLLTSTPSGYSVDCHDETGIFAAGCSLYTVAGPGPGADVALGNIGNVPISFLRFAATFGFTCSNANFPAGELIPPATTRIFPKEWFTNTSYMISWPEGLAGTDHVYWCFTQYAP